MNWFRERFRSVGLGILRLPAPVRLALLVVAMVVLLAGSVSAYRMYSYTQTDPSFCRTCHTMEQAWERWNTSTHSQVSCKSCHESTAIQSMEQVIKYYLQRPDQVSRHAFVKDEACESCHAARNASWTKVTETAGHQVHAENQNISCVKCHSVTIHRFKPPTAICAVCHEDKVYGEKAVKIDRMADFHCLRCHEFLRADSPLRAPAGSCLDCHRSLPQAKVTFPLDAPKQHMACSTCHMPHEQQKPVLACATCHDSVQTKGLHSAPIHQRQDCQTCHVPHEWKVKQRDACLTCHADRVEHNPGVSCQTCHAFRK